MAKYIPKYATSFAIGGGIGERAMRQYEGVDTQPLTYPTNDDEWEEAMGEFDVVNPPQETIDSDNDPGIVRGAAETGLDAIMGIPRGIVSAGMGVWQLADWATMDLLPDWETNPLGKSKTALGGIVESLSSFATGFIPIVGWMGRAGRVGSAFQQGSKLTRGVRKIHSLGGRAAASAARIPVGGPVVKTVFGQKYLSVANQARLETQGFTSAAKRVKYSRWLAASVATDFTVWGAHEERMSDWLQKFPGMQQPVFEYLASDENDSELEGRMKNVLEGILFEAGIGAIGGLVKGTVWGIKAMKRGRGVKEAGGTPADIQEAMESTPGRPEAAEIIEGGTEARNILQETQNSPRTGLPVLDGGQPATGVRKTELPGGPIPLPEAARTPQPTTTYTTSLATETQERLRQELSRGKKVWRGEKGEGATPSDAGDFGSGRYSSTSKAEAGAYGKPGQITISMDNPLILSSREAYDQIAHKYGTVSGVAGKDVGEVGDEFARHGDIAGERAKRSKEALEGLRAEGYDGLVIVSPRKGKHAGSIEFVELPQTFDPKTASASATARLDALENAARDRIKNRQLPGKGRLKGGTTLGADLVDVAIIGAVRVVKAGIVGRKAIQDLIKTLGEEMGRKFSHADIQQIAKKIDAQLKDEKFVGAAKDVVEDRTQVPVTPREPGAKHGFDRNLQDPQGVAESREVLKDVSPIAGQTLPRDPAWTKDVAKQKRLDFEGTASASLQKIVTHVNAAIDKLELAGAANLQSMRKRAADVSGNNRQKIKKLNKILKDEIIPLQEGSVRYASVAPHQRMKPRDMEKRADREQQLADLEKHAINASTYRKTLTNLLANLKGPGRRVEIPDYGSKSWRDMTHGQQTRELRKRILDAEYGYLPHGADTIRMTAEQSKSLGNIARGVMRNIKLYDSTGALNVHELRTHLNTLHEEERAYLKGLVGLPGGRSDTGESTLKEGSGEFSQGQAGEHQKRILAAGLAWVNDPDFRPKGIPHDKLQRSDWEYYVEQIWENNDIDLTNVDQVQKAMGVGEDLASAAAKAAKLTNVMKILQQGYYLEIGDMAEKYMKLKSNGQAREAESLGAELIASFFNLNNMAEQWVRAGAMTGTALQARKAIDITEYLKNHNYINKGMDEIIQQLDMLVSSDVPDEVIQQYKKSMSIQGKLVNAGIEVWTNALISGPKTIFGVTTVGNVFGMMYFPFERMLGHGISGSYAKLTGQSTRAAKEFKEAQVVAKLMTNMVLQSNYTIRGFSRALTSNRSRAVPGSSMMDTLSTGPKSDRQALSAEAFWSPEAGARNNLGNWVKDDGGHWEFQTTQTGAILDYVGGILNLPGRTMRAMDEVFKTGVVRSTVESELATQAVKYIVHGRLGNKGLKGMWARTTGEGRETVTDRSGKVDIAKREAQDQELSADWGEGGPKVGKGKYADELVLFEEITAEVNGKMYKMIDENGSVYTKARVHEDALQQVMSEAKDNPNLQMGGIEFKQRHAEIMEAEWNPQLGAIGAEAEKMALTSTWQDPLTKGGITHSIQKLAQTHPTMRLIFPFMKTPRNLLKFVGDRNPVNPGLYTEYMRHQKAAKEALAEGAEQSYRAESRKAAELLGRVSMSVSLVTTATYLATSGVITGSGPKNYAARKNLEATGWQPYSFRIGNEYYSYIKAEPASSFLGIMADAVEISNHTHTMDYGETDLEQTMKAAIGSLTNNLTDKSYLMGLSNFLNAMQEPERYTQRVAMSYLTSMVPFSSFMYQTKGAIQKTLNNEDMHYRKARGFIDPFREKMGWNNAKVPLAYDLMGKPIKKPHGHWPSLGPVSFDWLNPFTVSQKVNDPVYQAIVEMKLNDGAPKGLIRGRIDIRDEYREGSDLSFYDSWQESTGNIQLGGRTLHQTMDRLVRHKDWKRLPKLATEGIDSPARNIFRSIIQKYRRAAFNQTMGQYSNTRNKYMHALAVQRQLQQGS